MSRSTFFASVTVFPRSLCKFSAFTLPKLSRCSSPRVGPMFMLTSSLLRQTTFVRQHLFLWWVGDGGWRLLGKQQTLSGAIFWESVLKITYAISLIKFWINLQEWKKKTNFVQVRLYRNLHKMLSKPHVWPPFWGDISSRARDFLWRARQSKCPFGSATVSVQWIWKVSSSCHTAVEPWRVWTRFSVLLADHTLSFTPHDSTHPLGTHLHSYSHKHMHRHTLRSKQKKSAAKYKSIFIHPKSFSPFEKQTQHSPGTRFINFVEINRGSS